MTTPSVINQLGVYFGGAYDTTLRRYGTAQVTGLGAVRRAKPKRLDPAEFYLGMAAGAEAGAVMFVHELGGSERRVAVAGATSGVKKVTHDIELELWCRSTESYAEDAADAVYALKEAIFARIHADRTCGSGGFEAGGFQVGEDREGGGTPFLAWEISEAESSVEVTKHTLTISFTATEYIHA